MIKKIKNKLKKSQIARNSMWMISATIIKMIISLFINMIVARYLGVTNYGIINYGLSFINFFTGVCTLGLGTITIKYLINEKDKQGEIMGTCIGMRLISSIISVLLIFIIVFILKSDDQTIIFATFLQSLSLIFESFTVIEWWYQYKLQSKYTSIIIFIAYLCMAIYKLILVFFKKNVLWFSFSNCISSIVIALLLIILYKKNKSPKFSFSLSKAKTLINESYHFILSSLMVAIYAQTDKIMIGSMTNNIADVGLYAVSTTIVSLWSFLPNAVISSFKPVILEIKKVSYERYKIKLKQLYSIIVWLSIAYTLFIFILGKPIIMILYGNEYLGSLSTLRIAIFGVTFSFVGVIREFWLVCEGKQKYAKWFAIVGVITNILLNVILIPIMGITGAAIATAMTQIATALIAPLFFKEVRESVKDFACGLFFKFQ